MTGSLNKEKAGVSAAGPRAQATLRAGPDAGATP